MKKVGLDQRTNSGLVLSEVRGFDSRKHHLGI